MLVDELRLPVSNEQKRIAVEFSHTTLELNATGQEDRHWHVVLAHVFQERALESLRIFDGPSSVSLEVHTPTRPTAPALSPQQEHQRDGVLGAE